MAPPERPDAEHFDVLIIGAGVSGIGAAWHLQHNLPGKTYAILEAREAIGGTWDLFRYPGIRSDSDLHTFGYAFKPWMGEKSIADGPAILSYVRETAQENGIDGKIRFGHRVVAADWSSPDARWTVRAQVAGGDHTVALTASWIFCASGYYRYDRGYLPDFEGTGNFQGQVIHPQQWPEELDYSGKRVVVIGSGATAVTLVPAMTDKAAHVTMLQRSPTYIVALPEKDRVANFMKRHLAADRAYSLIRRKNIWMQKMTYGMSQKHPGLAKRLIRWMLERQLPDGYDIDRHFTPSYNPWDQRLCSVPNGDLFTAIRLGKASVVTGRIDCFTKRGVRLESGEELAADIVVTATGLEILAFGGAQMTVDGSPVKLSETLAYRGMMLSDVPNFVFAIGYTNSSWTLKVDLVFDYACRVMRTMDERGYAICMPVNDDPSMPTHPLLDFAAGYVQRAVDTLPREGDRAPWELSMNYVKDRKALKREPIEDGVLRFLPVGRPRGEAPALSGMPGS